VPPSLTRLSYSLLYSLGAQQIRTNTLRNCCAQPLLVAETLEERHCYAEPPNPGHGAKETMPPLHTLRQGSPALRSSKVVAPRGSKAANNAA